MSKKKWKPFVAIVKAMHNKSSAGPIPDKTVQVECKANSEGHARHRAIELIRQAYPHLNGFMILATSGIDSDGRLTDNSVLDYKATEMLADGDIAKINPGKQDKPEQKALVIPEPTSKPRAGRKPVPATAQVRSYASLASPFTDEVLELCASDKEVLKYDSSNRPDGMMEFTKQVATGDK